MKSPAFQFYASDWLGSQRVQMLSLKEEGAYIRLLCFCWQHGSIPADALLAARIIGKGASTTLARVVQAMFQQHPTDSSILVHDRLDAEKGKQAAWKAKSAAGGVKSAEQRAKGGSSKEPRVVEECYQPKGNSPSPSPSPSPNPKKKKTDLVFPENASVGRVESLRTWLAYKTEKRQGYQPMGWKALMTEISKFSDTEIAEAIQLAMAKNWDGFFPKHATPAPNQNGAAPPKPVFNKSFIPPDDRWMKNLVDHHPTPMRKEDLKNLLAGGTLTWEGLHDYERERVARAMSTQYPEAFK